MSIDRAVSGCEWRAGMLITLCLWFRSRLNVVWIRGESDGDRRDECSDREHAAGVETVEECLREAVLACLGELVTLRTHDGIYLNWTKATSHQVVNRTLVGRFSKQQHSDTSEVTEIGCAFCTGGGGAWQYPCKAWKGSSVRRLALNVTPVITFFALSDRTI